MSTVADSTVVEQPPTTPTPPTGEPAPAEAEVANTDSYDTLAINGISFTVKSTVTAKKGKSPGGKLLIIIEPPKLPDGSFDFHGLHGQLREAVGAANWDKTVYTEVVRKMCVDSTAQAVKVSEEGIPSDEGLAKAIVDWYNPESRRGEHVKDLREKSLALYAELNPYLIRAYSKPEDGLEPLSEQERVWVLQKMAEFAELNAKLEEKSKKGKARKKSA